MIYTANYSSVDSVISAWAQRHTLKLYTQYKDYEVRSVDVYSDKKFQIWIDRPEHDTVAVHVWDYENKPRDWKVQTELLNEALEEAIQATRPKK